jgi:hypothetical protein
MRLDFSLAMCDICALENAETTTTLPNDAVPAQPTTNGSFARVNLPLTPSILAPLPAPPPRGSFTEYLEARPRWQWELLIRAFPTNGTDKLGQHLLNGDRLLLCSDGGAKNNSGSFGWVIETSKTFLWECSGIASGWFANSFRSEGVGQLALLVFLEAYTTYHQLQNLPRPQYHATADPWNRIATDNQGLIARIKTGLAAKTVFAGAALSAEHDVVHEILEITNRLPFPLTWEHVKGHQDQHRKWYELTWMETLNARTDYHATEGLATEGNPSTLVTLIPSSKLGLRIATTDITSHYPHTYVKRRRAPLCSNGSRNTTDGLKPSSI